MPRQPSDPSPRRRRAADGEADFWGASPSWSSGAAPDAEPPASSGRPGRNRGRGTRWRTHGDPTSELPVVAATDPTDPVRAFDPFDDDPFDDDLTFARPAEAMAWDVDAWDAATEGPADERADWDGEWSVAPQPPTRRRSGPIDPLVARLGGLAVLVTLAVPAVLGFTGGSSSTDETLLAATPTTAAIVPAGSAADLSTTPSTVPTTQAAAPATTPASPATAPTTDAAPTTVSQATTPVTTAPDEAATLRATAAPEAAPACGAEYEIAAGDYWIRIADAADVPLADLLAVNGATVKTVLVPGRSICLPPGASTPAPPATAAPTTAAPTTAAPTTAAPTTQPPTTQPPTTPAPPPPPAPTTPAVPADVEAIIRDVWPDELEDRALQIAWRESNHIPTAKNSCCYGLFQIHWTAHRSWLAQYGVTTADHLFEPRINATAAYILYQRAGGWGPWGG